MTQEWFSTESTRQAHKPQRGSKSRWRAPHMALYAPVVPHSGGVHRLLDRLRPLGAEQFHPAFNIDHHPGQQILDADAPATTVAGATAIMVAHHIGQFAFDPWMLPPHCGIWWCLGPGPGGIILCLVVMLDDAPPLVLG